jgi:hypothetical protein
MAMIDLFLANIAILVSGILVGVPTPPRLLPDPATSYI